MKDFNFNNKTFSLLQNSNEGQVDSETKFHYQQDGQLVTADYHGGSVQYGKIIAQLRGDQLHMLYQCLTTDDQLKAGRAVANITLTDSGKIKLELIWEWLGDQLGSGNSTYLED